MVDFYNNFRKSTQMKEKKNKIRSYGNRRNISVFSQNPKT